MVTEKFQKSPVVQTGATSIEVEDEGMVRAGDILMKVEEEKV